MTTGYQDNNTQLIADNQEIEIKNCEASESSIKNQRRGQEIIPSSAANTCHTHQSCSYCMSSG